MKGFETSINDVLLLMDASRWKDALHAWDASEAVLSTEPQGWLIRAEILSRTGLNEAALAAAITCTKMDQDSVAGWLAVSELAGPNQRDLSTGAALRAIRIAERMDLRQVPPPIRRRLSNASLRMRTALLDLLDRVMDPIEEEYGRDAMARLRKGARMFTGMEPLVFAHPLWRPGLFYVPDLPPVMFFQPSEFPWANEAEAATESVRSEFLQLQATLDGGFTPYVTHPEGSNAANTWRAVNNSMSWNTRHFFRHGERVDETHQHCPMTSAMLEKMDLQYIPGYGPECMFSVLRARSRIPAHYGSVNGRLIVHLPLIVPPNCGAIRVGTETRSWEEGRLMVFDDSFQHEAWNDSDEERAVLIFDAWNPHITPVERIAYSALLVEAQSFESRMLLGTPLSGATH